MITYPSVEYVRNAEAQTYGMTVRGLGVIIVIGLIHNERINKRCHILQPY